MKEKRKRGKSSLLFLEVCLVEDDTSPCIIDSRQTNHVCSSLHMLSSSRELAKEEFTLRASTGTVVSAMLVGVVNMYFRNKYLFLNNIY